MCSNLTTLSSNSIQIKTPALYTFMIPKLTEKNKCIHNYKKKIPNRSQNPEENTLMKIFKSMKIYIGTNTREL